MSAPVILDTTGLFVERAARVGEDVFVTGQPTERALRELRAQGVTTVVNLRTPEEMTRNVNFDEPAIVAKLGMRYVFLPVRGRTEYPYSPATLANARAINLMDDHRVGPNGRQPVEDFLDKALPTLGHPPR